MVGSKASVSTPTILIIHVQDILISFSSANFGKLIIYSFLWNVHNSVFMSSFSSFRQLLFQLDQLLTPRAVLPGTVVASGTTDVATEVDVALVTLGESWIAVAPKTFAESWKLLVRSGCCSRNSGCYSNRRSNCCCTGNDSCVRNGWCTVCWMSENMCGIWHSCCIRSCDNSCCGIRNVCCIGISSCCISDIVRIRNGLSGVFGLLWLCPVVIEVRSDLAVRRRRRSRRLLIISLLGIFHREEQSRRSITESSKTYERKTEIVNFAIILLSSALIYYLPI